MADLPKRYKPSHLRAPPEPERKEVTYAAGFEDRPGSYGFFAGPNPVLEEVLEHEPQCASLEEMAKRVFVIRFNLDGTAEAIYQWDHRTKEWVRFVQR